MSSLGVDCFFGCDEQELMLLKDKNVRYVRMQHEQAAVHATDGFARATGKPGVVLLTTASGITNSITGIATAYSDSVPLVIIAGQIHDDPLHTNHEAFHELNISGLTMAITKHALKINNIEGMDQALKNTLTIATNGRPGPVLLELTTDTTMNVTQNHRLGQPQVKRGNRIENSIKMAMSLIETTITTIKPYYLDKKTPNHCGIQRFGVFF
ncbi:thiamine pyrophosphate-binding protein [Bacillus sp. ISL-46]|uniref:thiamine pyrophosphate-binding protein n=1 Tax=Bacillus sp. ISL-46 TaxID=2819129 RepID=UPI0027E19765|nr:thiamine pyrophosphate-binding protein [Bacillus sp. ISL-46]